MLMEYNMFPHMFAVSDEAENKEDFLSEVAQLIFGKVGDLSSVWDAANRVCDRYNLKACDRHEGQHAAQARRAA